jgi:hypothetical protein
MKLTTVLAFFWILAATVAANADIVVAISGPNGGGEPVSTSQFVAFQWISSDTHVDVSVFANLAADSASIPFLGTAYLTSGPSPSMLVAQSEFDVTSQTPSYVELFHGLTLPPDNSPPLVYQLTLAGIGPGAGVWEVGLPVAYLSTSPDSGLFGGDLESQSSRLDPAYPPGSGFGPGGLQTEFAVTDMGTGIVAEPSSMAPLAGLLALLAIRHRAARKHSG